LGDWLWLRESAIFDIEKDGNIHAENFIGKDALRLAKLFQPKNFTTFKCT
jgi:hypothetical protein